jgi:hypothetical protein
MNIVIWLLQILLGVVFVFHATLLLRPNPARLQQGMNYILEMAAPFAASPALPKAWPASPSLLRHFWGHCTGWCRSRRQASWS